MTYTFPALVLGEAILRVINLPTRLSEVKGVGHKVEHMSVAWCSYVQYLPGMYRAAEASSTCRVYPVETSTELELLLANAVAAGFPSPAQDYQDGVIDLNRELVVHPRSTFCVVVDGDSMLDAQLQDGDVLIVDKSVEVYDGCVAVCILDGDFTVKFFHRVDGRVVLRPANTKYRPIVVEPEQDFSVWGIVCYVIHKTHRR